MFGFNLGAHNRYYDLETVSLVMNTLDFGIDLKTSGFRFIPTLGVSWTF